MFKALRGCKHIELLSTSNKMLIDQWKVHSAVKKEYDEQVKTYIYNVGGKSPVVKMFFPKDKKQKLDLHYPLLVLQLYFPYKANILCDIGVTSCSGQRKRITLSSNQKSKHNSLFTVIPFAIENGNSWIHLIVDVEEIVSAMWNGEKFRGIDFLALSGVFRLKRIFLLTGDLAELTEGACAIKYDQLPKQMKLSKNILQSFKYVSSSNNSFECLMGANSEDRSTSSLQSSRNSSSCSLRSGRFGRKEITNITSSKEYSDQDARSFNEEAHFKGFETEFKFNLSTLRFSEGIDLEHLNKINLNDSPGKREKSCSEENELGTMTAAGSVERELEFHMPLCYSENS